MYVSVTARKISCYPALVESLHCNNCNNRVSTPAQSLVV